jgi:hypothetical protein
MGRMRRRAGIEGWNRKDEKKSGNGGMGWEG